MVATIAAGTSAGYYTRQAEYYHASGEPPGHWVRAPEAFGIREGTEVEPALFEHLHGGYSADGTMLVGRTNAQGRRVCGYDLTFSAPKSISIVWALGSAELRSAIETAQADAVAQALLFLERNAAFSRRGRGGERLEKAELLAAAFRHGESRPAMHRDGVVFADPNVHTHSVILNLAARADGSVGAIDERHLFRWKMAAGALYHAALAASVQRLGFTISEIGKNGIFELEAVPREARDYFSARRAEIESDLSEKGFSSAEAPALAAALALVSRKAKADTADNDRHTQWRLHATRQGFELEDIGTWTRPDLHSWRADEETARARLKLVPRLLTETSATFERRHLAAAVATLLVGTGLGPDEVEPALQYLAESGTVVELGRDLLGQAVLSTPEMVATERELLLLAEGLRRARFTPVPSSEVGPLCRFHGLSTEQAEVVRAATGPHAIAVYEGAAGSGKTTSLKPIVEAYRNLGCRVIGSATAWRIAHALRDDLGIDSRATDSWIASSKAGQQFLDHQTVLVVDEAGQLSVRQMHALLSEVKAAEAKLILVGDRQQLQPIGAGPALSVVASVVGVTRVDTIVRQREGWARTAVNAFARGDTSAGLLAFAQRELLSVHDGDAKTITALVAAWRCVAAHQRLKTLLIARSNAQVRTLNASVRQCLREEGSLRGIDFSLKARTASGHTHHLSVAVGDQVRFLARQDQLGVINGTVANISALIPLCDGHLRVSAQLDNGQIISFATSDVTDAKGCVSLAHAYATTVYGAQGLTTEEAFVLLDSSFDRHDAYVAVSRARGRTRLFANQRAIDARVRAELLLSDRNGGEEVTPDARLTFLARYLARQNVKTSTLDPIDGHARAAEASHSRDMARG